MIRLILFAFVALATRLSSVAPAPTVRPKATTALRREASLFDRPRTAADAYRAIRADATATDPATGTLIDQLRAQLRDRLSTRQQVAADVDALHNAVQARGESNLNEDEMRQHAELVERARQLDIEILGDGDSGPGLQQRIADMEAEASRRSQYESMSAALGVEPPAAGDGETRLDVGEGETRTLPIVTGGDEQVYRSGRYDFLQDAYRAWRGTDAEARDRIVRSSRREIDVAKRAGNPLTFNGAEVRSVEYRDTTTASFVNLVIPEYLVSEAAAAARSGAPVASIVRTIPLPERGMTVNTSRQTTGTSAGAQASEGDAPSETDQVWAAYNIPVVTTTGKQDISRQSIDRGEAIGALTLGDLVDAYYEDLDTQLVNGATGSGEHQGLLNVSGINSVTYTDASPTAPELWPKLANAVSDVASNRKRPATHWIMHPRRFAFLLSEVDGSNRPLVVPVAVAQNPMAVGGVPTVGDGGGVIYTLMGLPIVQDPNVPTSLGTNEDAIIALRATDSPLLWENGGVPRTMTFDMLSPEEVTVAVWGYSAFGSGRYPTSISAITGTGLIAPTF